MFGLGTQELVIILFIAFFIFGAKRLPEIGSGLGKAIREFKKATSERKEDSLENSTSDREPHHDTRHRS